MADNETIDPNTESFVHLLQTFEAGGEIADLQAALRVRERTAEALTQALKNDGVAQKPSKIDCTRFDYFVHSLNKEAEKGWPFAPQGRPWYAIPKKELETVQKAIVEFEKQLDIRRLIPKNSSPAFWQAFRSISEQILRGLLNIQTLTTVIQKIPNNVLWDVSYVARKAPPASKKRVGQSVDDPTSQFLADGTPLPDDYHDFLSLLKKDPSLINNFRYIYGRYMRHANKNGDWANVVFFGRVISKHSPDDINTTMILARGLEQVGSGSELKEAVILLEKLLANIQKAKNEAKIKEATALLRSVRGKLTTIRVGLPQKYRELTDAMLTECGPGALIEYIQQARADKNFVRAAFLSAELVRRFGNNDSALRNLSSDLERAGLIEAAGVIRGKIEWVNRDDGDDSRIERLRKGLPRLYLDVNDAMITKCNEKDLICYASQARKSGDFKSAARFQGRLVVIMPNELQTAMRFAGDLQRAGNLKEALDAYRKIADLMLDDESKKTTHIIIHDLEEIVKNT